MVFNICLLMVDSEAEMCSNVFHSSLLSVSQHAAGSYNTIVIACSGRGEGKLR